MKRLFALFMLAVVTVGCSPKPEEVVPTLIPSLQPANAASATPPPTDVPPPTQVPVERPTLPPTWTPSPEPTNTVLPPTETPVPVWTAIPTLVACGSFDVDRNKSAATFTVGKPAQVFWVPVQGAARYRISVLDGTNQEVLVDYAVEPTYTFAPDAFEAGKRYAWRVYPEDSLSRQMCFAVTGDMSPTQ